MDSTGLGGRRPEQRGELPDDGVFYRVISKAVPLIRGQTDEPKDRPRPPIRRRGVMDLHKRPPPTDRVAGQPGLPPKRGLVSDQRLGVSGHPCGDGPETRAVLVRYHPRKIN